MAPLSSEALRSLEQCALVLTTLSASAKLICIVKPQKACTMPTLPPTCAQGVSTDSSSSGIYKRPPCLSLSVAQHPAVSCDVLLTAVLPCWHAAGAKQTPSSQI